MASQDKQVSVDGYEMTISNPNKYLFAEKRISKWDYILHCLRLSPYLLPYCRDRCLTMIRYPNGLYGGSFYQKHAHPNCPPWVQTCQVNEKERILLNNTPTLVWLANLACLEFHVTFHLFARPQYPTELVFDLDPSTSEFSPVVEVALQTREVLKHLGLDGLVKTSGATGLQIYVPIKPLYTYQQTRQVSQFIAQYLVERFPKTITIERKKKKRGTKVYFDYLQHGQGKTLIAPYSPRAVPEATVSTPLTWGELPTVQSPKQFHLAMIFARLEEKGDLFRPLLAKMRYPLDEILSFLEKHLPE